MTLPLVDDGKRIAIITATVLGPTHANVRYVTVKQGDTPRRHGTRYVNDDGGIGLLPDAEYRKPHVSFSDSVTAWCEEDYAGRLFVECIQQLRVACMKQISSLQERTAILADIPFPTKD